MGDQDLGAAVNKDGINHYRRPCQQAERDCDCISTCKERYNLHMRRFIAAVKSEQSVAGIQGFRMMFRKIRIRSSTQRQKSISAQFDMSSHKMQK